MKTFRSFFHPSLTDCIRRSAQTNATVHLFQSCCLRVGIMIAIAPFALERAAALDRTWIGGNVDWVDAGSTANWNPADEPDVDDTAIFNTPNPVNLSSNNSILALTMSGGISVNTNNFDLTLDGLLQLAGAGTDLTIGGTAGSVFADDMTINSGAEIILSGGTLTMAKNVGAGLFDINAGGILTGQGTVTLSDAGLGAATSLLTNSGTISVAVPGIVIGNPAAGTLAINAADVTNARLDLDLGGTAVLNVFRNQTLDINVTLADPYSDDLNLFHNSTIDVSTPWSIDAGATVDIDNGFVDNGGILNIPASTSFISGAAFTQSGGTITVIDGDGALQFNAPFTMSGGSLVNNGKVVFNANATIAAGATFSGTGALVIPSTSNLVAAANANINVLLNLAGTFRPAGFDTVGPIDLRDYQQAATGKLLIEITGTGLNQFDRLVVTGGVQVAGTLDLDLDAGFLPTLGQTFTITSAVGGVTGTFGTVIQPPDMPAGLKFQVNYQPTLVQLQVVALSPFEIWINTFVALTDPADKTKEANPDGDALNNFGEFGLDGNPASGISSGNIVGKIAPVGGANAMTLTFPVRNGAILDVEDPAGGELVLKQVADGLNYRVQATDDFVAFPLTVTAVTGPDATAIQLGLPAPSAGWTYRTFRSPGGVLGDPVEFMRVVVSD